MELIGANFSLLIDDLDAALRELEAPFRRRPSVWTAGRPGAWTVGQHADHVAVGLEVTADAFEHADRERARGALESPPGRGPLQALFIAVAVKRGRFPRGGRAPRILRPGLAPRPDDVLARLAHGAARHRALGERLDAAAQDRLWIRNPFLTRWHYRFPEVLRVQAVHARHHLRHVERIATRSVT